MFKFNSFDSEKTINISSSYILLNQELIPQTDKFYRLNIEQHDIVSKIVFLVDSTIDLSELQMEIRSSYLINCTEYKLQNVGTLKKVTFDLTKQVKHLSNSEFDGLYYGVAGFMVQVNFVPICAYGFYKRFNSAKCEEMLVGIKYQPPEYIFHDIKQQWKVFYTHIQNIKLQKSFVKEAIEHPYVNKLTKIEICSDALLEAIEIACEPSGLRTEHGQHYNLFSLAPAELFYEDNKYVIDMHDYWSHSDLWIIIQSNSENQCQLKLHCEMGLSVNEDGILIQTLSS